MTASAYAAGSDDSLRALIAVRSQSMPASAPVFGSVLGPWPVSTTSTSVRALIFSSRVIQFSALLSSSWTRNRWYPGAATLSFADRTRWSGKVISELECASVGLKPPRLSVLMSVLMPILMPVLCRSSCPMPSLCRRLKCRCS